MKLAAIFRVFRHSSLITDRGPIPISRVFATCGAAQKAHYRYFRMDNGTLIYSRRTKSGQRRYAIIDR